MTNPLDLFGAGSLPRQGQFYYLDKNFTKAQLDQLLKNLKSDLSPALPPVGQADWSIIQDAFSGTVGTVSWSALGSALVSPFETEPIFLKGAGITETKHGYVLLVELTFASTQPVTFLFVQRSYFGDPLALFPTDSAASSWPVPTEIEGAAFLEPFTKDSTVRIESLSMKPLSLQQQSLRRKLLEAYDIKDVISTLGLTRTIAGSMKVIDDAGKIRRALRPRQRKLSESGRRSEVTAIVEWAAEMAKKFHDAAKVMELTSPFLSSFARAVSSLPGKTAESCLFDTWIFGELLYRPRPGEEIRLVRQTAAGLVKLSVAEAEILFGELEQFVSLSTTGTTSTKFIAKFPGATLIPEVRIDVRKTTCTVSLPKCEICVEELALPGKVVSLASFLNERKLFRVVFDNGATVFTAEGIYGDGNIQRSAQLLAGMLRGTPVLNPVTTEKGELQTKKASAFDVDSTFYQIENGIAATADWLVCEDSSDEWADYISLTAGGATGPVLCWYHAKMHRHKDVTSGKLKAASASQSMRSASKLQEVIGQAVKNLGRVRMKAGDTEVQARVNVWSKVYSFPDGKKVKTSMPRIRKKPTVSPKTAKVCAAHFLDEYDAAAGNPLTRVEVAIVVPNYSKQALLKSFKKLGTGSATKTAPQVYWLLSGFMSACIEAGVTPVFYCRD